MECFKKFLLLCTTTQTKTDLTINVVTMNMYDSCKKAVIIEVDLDVDQEQQLKSLCLLWNQMTRKADTYSGFVVREICTATVVLTGLKLLKVRFWEKRMSWNKLYRMRWISCVVTVLQDEELPSSIVLVSFSACVWNREGCALFLLPFYYACTCTCTCSWRHVLLSVHAIESQ